MQFNYFLYECLILYGLRAFGSVEALVGRGIEEVRGGEFEFIVSLSELITTRRTQHYCTGALVSTKNVLTAHHCLFNKDISRVKIIVGSNDLQRGRRYSVAWWIDFDTWSELLDMPPRFVVNDIAMLRLKQSVIGNLTLGVIANIENSELYGSTVQIAGWGVSNVGRTLNLLHKANLTVISLDECIERLSRLTGERTEFFLPIICTYAVPYALAHQGDSGTPIIYSNSIVGITKGTCPFPERNVHPDKLNIHVGTYYYRDFIIDVIHNMR